MTRVTLARLDQLQVAGPIFRTGMWTTVPHASRSTLALTQDRLYYCPLPVAQQITVNRLGIETTVAGATGALMRLGIYADDGTGYPGALVLDAGTVATDGATGAKEITGLTQVLLPARYWIAASPQIATPPTVRTVNLPTYSLPASAFAGTAPNNQVQQAGVTGALPATAAPTSASNGGMPMVAVMVA